jgi:hypothetical protein
MYVCTTLYSIQVCKKKWYTSVGTVFQSSNAEQIVLQSTVIMKMKAFEGVNSKRRGFEPTFLFGSATPSASPPLWPSIFSDYSFWVHRLVNWDGRHLLAHAMASDFSVAWQCLWMRTIVFLLQIKLHAQEPLILWWWPLRQGPKNRLSSQSLESSCSPVSKMSASDIVSLQTLQDM